MAFQHGLSGLNAASKNLDVIGNNIANSNTTGFKSSRTEFADMVAASMGAGGGSNYGIGVEVAAVAQQFSQGNVTVTGNNLDVAINGNGFFKVQQPDGSAAYTRGGNFKLDKTGDLVTNGGAQVMGFKVDPATGLSTSEAQPLSFPTGSPIQAKQTESIKATLNLDARATGNPAKAGPPAVAAVAPADRSTYGTSINVYDTQGVPLPVNVYFQKSDSNQWDVYDKLDDRSANPPVIGRFVGKLEMDGNGNIKGMTQPSTWDPLTGNPLSGQKITRKPDGTFETTAMSWAWTAVTDTSTPPKTIGWNSVETPGAVTAGPSTFDFNLALTVDPKGTNPNNPPVPFSVSLNLKDVTQFGSKFAVADLSQDGYASGDLTSINISNDGMVMASYSNGVTRAEAQVALANFRNPQGLLAVGGNNWVESFDSGPAVMGKPGDGNFGALRSGALEDSNVDLTAELVNMMTAQRAYQANAQTIKTQDQVMSTLVNLR
ncbi:flagellar basal-body rod protein FlgF [Acidovorax carolinensis]|uniref:Flagellar basal-body rod protein FlgF n=1 Tax=Acidovorax carolinensis TaxID=553814 RepID=A0A240U6G9_9BURK|nr:flagellar hook protein FlgE [Acidovorax carolinensis]ART53007.1 flagellar basal-body rod protein FlgF [Acidovorax carolinensis]